MGEMTKQGRAPDMIEGNIMRFILSMIYCLNQSVSLNHKEML